MTKPWLGITVLLLIGAGCTTTPDATSPVSSHAVRAAQPVNKGRRVFGQQASFLALADSIRGFAGVFVGPDQHPRIAMVAGSDVGAAVAAVNRRWPDGVNGEAVSSARQVAARYDYRQLVDWKESLEGSFAKVASAFGVHVTTNTVDVYSPDASTDSAIEAFASASAIPLNAIRLVRAAKPENLGIDLKAPIRDTVPGSFGIWWDDFGAPFGCTIGVNAKMDNSMGAPWVALTASHCTTTTGGGADGTTIYQGGYLSLDHSKTLGYESDDGYWNTSGCDTGYFYCRAADVAVITYSSTTSPVADSGYIGVTTGRNTSSTTYVSKDSTGISISGGWGEQPWEGISLDEVGAYGGWHSGTVTDACVDVVAAGFPLNDHEWQCLTEVSGTPSHGDSGGPVFSSRIIGKSTMWAGIISAYMHTTTTTDSTHYLFSSYVNICTEYSFCPVIAKTWP